MCANDRSPDHPFAIPSLVSNERRGRGSSLPLRSGAEAETFVAMNAMVHRIAPTSWHALAFGVRLALIGVCFWLSQPTTVTITGAAPGSGSKPTGAGGATSTVSQDYVEHRRKQLRG